MKPRQKKSRFYYYFWGVATVAVVAGQIYVTQMKPGFGYRVMATSVDNFLEKVK
jgi:Na+/H+-dicarboxylate symporter